jgi:hypothetical protein
MTSLTRDRRRAVACPTLLAVFRAALSLPIVALTLRATVEVGSGTAGPRGSGR